MRRQPPYIQILFAGISLGMIGWGGLYLVFNLTLPTLGPRWLFFFFLMVGVSGPMLPIFALIHRRFPGSQLVDGSVVVREAVMVGLYVCLLAWLQMGRLFDLNRAMFLALGFIAVEILLLWYERSRWKPKEPPHE